MSGRKLAVLGGRPSFTSPLHVGRPNVGDEAQFFARLRGVLQRRWLTNYGPLVQEFECRLQAITGVKHCVATCNATVALEVLVRVLELTGEVICPSFTFVATAHALQWLGIKPIFCDIDPATHCIDPSCAESLISGTTSAVLGVHVWGQPCDVDALTALAKRAGIRAIFDAAHAFASSHDEIMVGNFGDAEVFSFHATKFVNSFEGGAIATNSDEIAAKARLMINFGFQGYDTVVCLGSNGKMTEVAAAMGLTSLDALDGIVAANTRNYQQYEAELSGVPGLRLYRFTGSGRRNQQYVVLEVDETVTGLGRDDLVRVLHAENILARRYFYPGCHRMEPYRSRPGHVRVPLINTDRLAARVLALPTGCSVDELEVREICQVLQLAVAESEQIRSLG